MSEQGGIEKILDHILNSCPASTGDNGKGGECPYCGSDGWLEEKLENIEHYPDCIYLIAKDLKKIL